MSWKDNMHEAIAEMLREKIHLDVVKVIDFEDYTYYGGYCETCAYEDTKCKITYVDSGGNTEIYDYWSSFSEIINSLLGK